MKKYILTIGVIVLGFYTYAQNNVYGKYVKAIDSLAVGSNVASDGNSLTVDNININGNTINANNGDLTLSSTSGIISANSKTLGDVTTLWIREGTDGAAVSVFASTGIGTFSTIAGYDFNLTVGGTQALGVDASTNDFDFQTNSLTDIGSLTVDNININGNTISTSSGDVQFNTENVIDIATLDTDSLYVSGNVDIQGTLDLSDNLTINGTTQRILTVGTGGTSSHRIVLAADRTGAGEPVGIIDGQDYSSGANIARIRLENGSTATGTTGQIRFQSYNSGFVDALLLEEDGQATFSGTIISTGVRDNTTASAANMFINATTGLMYRSTSSRKYKHNIENLDLSESTFKNIRPVEYTSNSDSLQYFGYIAEDIDSLGLTQLVQYVEDSIGNKTPDGLNYGAFTAINTAMIQKLLLRIEELEALVDSLK